MKLFTKEHKWYIYGTLFTLLAMAVFGWLIYYYVDYYNQVETMNNAVSVGLNTSVPLPVSIQDQSSNWNVYSSPQFRVQFKYPNFSNFGTVDGGVSSQGKSDASIVIRPDNDTSVNDFLNGQILNQGSGDTFSPTYGVNPVIQVANVDGQSGELIEATGTIAGDTGKDILIIEYPKEVSITNTVGGAEKYQYLTMTFTNMNVGIVGEIIATIKFIGL